MRGTRRLPTIRDRIEQGFGAWAVIVDRHRWLLILVMILVPAGLATRIPHLAIETSTEEYFYDSDPAKVVYDAFRDQFGRDQPAMILLEPESVFDLDFLEELVALHRDLEDSVVHLEEVTSLYNVRSVYGRGDELLVDDLLEEMPADEAELAALRERVMGTPSYLDTVVSADGRIAIIVVEAQAYSPDAAPEDALGGFEESDATEGERVFLTGRETSAFCRSVFEVVERHRREGLEIHLTGQPLITFALTQAMADDFPKIFGVSMALISALVVLLFRRLSPVLLSAMVVVLSMVTSLGVAELLGIALSIPTQVLPSFLLAVGVGYAVHLLTIFFRALGEREDRVAALEDALRHVGPPILMTAVTTSAGLLSFLAADMEQIAELGVLGAVGVVVTLAYALILLPALLLVVPFRRPSSGGLEGGSLLLSAFARASVHHPVPIVGVALALAVGSIALIPSLDYSANPMTYFGEDHWLRQATFYADQRVAGMQSLEVSIDTGRENGLHEPDVLNAMDSLRRLVGELAVEGEKVGRTSSVLEVVKESHQALNENRADYYAIPQDRVLVAQELLLFENSGSDDLEDLVDTRFSKARFSVRTAWEDGVEKQRFLDRVSPRILGSLDGLAEVELTGAVSMIARMASATATSLIRSYALALVLITPLMMILIGSLRAGLVSMVPNLVPIMMALALMVLVGIEIDLFTMLGGCIAIGLAVDDSIHFITGFRRYLAQTGDPERAVELTMETTGRALLFTSIVLVAGFGVLGLSSMANLGYLGWTTAFAIGSAFVLDVTATPALLVLLYRK